MGKIEIGSKWYRAVGSIEIGVRFCPMRLSTIRVTPKSYLNRTLNDVVTANVYEIKSVLKMCFFKSPQEFKLSKCELNFNKMYVSIIDNIIFIALGYVTYGRGTASKETCKRTNENGKEKKKAIPGTIAEG